MRAYLKRFPLYNMFMLFIYYVNACDGPTWISLLDICVISNESHTGLQLISL